MTLVPECPLCEALNEHVAYKLEPRPIWVLMFTPVLQTPILVATDHNMEYDQVAHNEGIKRAIRGIFPAQRGRSFQVNWERGPKSKRGHTRFHIRSSYVYQDMPQGLADEIARVAEEAVQWFHDNSKVMTAVMTDNAISDEDVRRRIQGFQYAMDREIARIHSFEFSGGWSWRFDKDWRRQHNEWVAKYKDWVADKDLKSNLRYDLSELPWNVQRALCSRWQRLWEEWGSRGYTPEESYD